MVSWIFLHVGLSASRWLEHVGPVATGPHDPNRSRAPDKAVPTLLETSWAREIDGDSTCGTLRHLSAWTGFYIVLQTEGTYSLDQATSCLKRQFGILVVVLQEFLRQIITARTIEGCWHIETILWQQDLKVSEVHTFCWGSRQNSKPPGMQRTRLSRQSRHHHPPGHKTAAYLEICLRNLRKQKTSCTSRLAVWLSISGAWEAIAIAILEKNQEAQCALRYCIAPVYYYKVQSSLYTAVHSRDSLCKARSKTTLFSKHIGKWNNEALIHLIACKRFKLKIWGTKWPKKSGGLWWLIHWQVLLQSLFCSTTWLVTTSSNCTKEKQDVCHLCH